MNPNAPFALEMKKYPAGDANPARIHTQRAFWRAGPLLRLGLRKQL